MSNEYMTTPGGQRITIQQAKEAGFRFSEARVAVPTSTKSSKHFDRTNGSLPQSKSDWTDLTCLNGKFTVDEVNKSRAFV